MSNLILLFFSFLSGVCVGLSILCLIVVAITIGYKSETHYRLDNGNGGRKRIRLIKASSNESSSSSNSSGSEGDATSTDGENRSGIFNFEKKIFKHENFVKVIFMKMCANWFHEKISGGSNEDLNNANMKLGSWFTSKHPVQTLDRKKAKMVYPSAVYLDNLETGSDNATPGVKATNRSEALTDEENFEDDLNLRKTSRAQITRKVTLTDNNSVSSLGKKKTHKYFFFLVKMHRNVYLP